MLFNKNFLIGKELVNRKYITQDQLDEGLILHQRKNIRLGKALIELGYLTEDDLVQVIADQLSIPYINFAQEQIASDALALVPKEIAKSNNVMPIRVTDGTLLLCVSDPLVSNLQKTFEALLEMPILFAIASTDALRAAVQKHYSF
mgnify:CR=1 FL=1